ncbi:MAG TPA: phage tail sheath C-terminal domain-containing protein [Candidatus Limnocylindria bacterium]|jgi:phage tail sheath protein FI|nr:phage tail sheath C-terminal domain-containing protein [Candidatus Limnocylindria bacterium]
MAVTPTYPGVYIQEVDSGSRVVTGVATSVTAFVGRTIQGPANTPISVNDFGEFTRWFGGLSRDLPMPYTVRDFFNNGGSQAIIVRVCAGPPMGGPSTVALSQNPDYTLTTKARGSITKLFTIGATKHDDGTYDVAITLGKIELATLSAISPGQLDMGLKGLPSLIGVTGALTDDDAQKVLDALVTAPKAFDNGSDQTGATAASFQANDLVITSSVPGSWTDDLDLSLIPRGASGFALQADHPLFAMPLVVPFTDWNALKTDLAATKMIELTTPSAIEPKTFIGKGVPLTRVPDGSGASAAMLVRGPLVLMASSPGAWGNQLAVYFDQKGIKSPGDLAMRYADFGDVAAKDFWNINVFVAQKGQPLTTPAETIGPVYLGPVDAPCRIDHVLKAESNLLTARAPLASPAISDLILDPSVVGVANDPKDPKHKLGVLWGGQDGETLATDGVVGDENARTGIYALKQVDLFNILVIPPDPLLAGDDDMNAIYTTAAKFCADRRAILIVDPLDAWGFAAKKGMFDRIQPTNVPLGTITSRRAAFTYFPKVKMADPLNNNRERVFPASGIIAGVFASTDVRRGVWKAPAGIEAGMAGVTGLEHRLTDDQNGTLNQVGVNVLRDFPVIGPVVWGSRTMAGADALSDDYKYLPVRRLTNYIEESLFRGTKFAVFEPNAEPLWSQLRLTINTFMADLSRQGAFYDYYVRCDKSTTTAYDIDRGRVNVIVAFAPVKPAEFVILTIQQLAGQTAA